MIVYALRDPFTGGIRYVGQTTKTKEARLRQHFHKASLSKPGHKNHWLKTLDGRKPEVWTLQTCSTFEELDEAERNWIEFLKAEGCSLTNSTSGGEGLRNPSLEVRARMSESKKGKPSWKKGTHLSEETKEKLRRANVGRKATLSAKLKMSEIQKKRQENRPNRIVDMKTYRVEYMRKWRAEHPDYFKSEEQKAKAAIRTARWRAKQRKEGI